MKKNLSYHLASVAAALLLLVAVSSIALAATYVTNTTIGNVPAGSGATGWTFTATSDTNLGESVCIEVHPVGTGTGNYVRTECTHTSGTNPSNWTCNVFTTGVPGNFRNRTVEYQFFVANTGSGCNTNTHAFTGFNWRFRTDANGSPAPLAVTMSDFSASRVESGVRVTWETVSETNMLGFNLLRATSAEGTPEVINPALIPASGSSAGASYEFLDEEAAPESAYYYWLDAIEVTGDTERFGPVMAPAQGPTAVTLGSAGAAPTATMPLLALAGVAALGALALLRRRA